jgi:peptide deformylase
VQEKKLTENQSRPLPESGTVRRIVRWGEPIMHRELADVRVFDESLRRTVADMVATMHAADGVGLAGNQMDVDLKIFVFDCPDSSGQHVTGVVCNPVLHLPLVADRRLDDAGEGCLSLPGAFTSCARPDLSRVTGLDEFGEPVEFAGTGLLARCLQHETDHLYGTVFGDRLSDRLRKKLFREAEEVSPHYPKDWPATPMIG